MKCKSEKNKVNFSFKKELSKCAKATNRLNAEMSYTFATLLYQVEIVWRFFSMPFKCLGKFVRK